ncbi:MAG: glycosyltransferase involved in cell wall biosynthesis [Planctomycetota bacterium]
MSNTPDNHMPASSQSSDQMPEPPRSAGGVTLVVPAYDEENGIEGVVERLAALELGVPFELLVVNDGSEDATGERLEELSKRFPVLRVIEHPINRGYGAALKTGFAAAKHDVVVITDADGTYPEDRIKDLLARIDDGAEMAIGARIGANVHIPLIRRPAKNVLRLLASYLAGRKIPDLNSGLRAFRRELVMKYVPVLPNGFSFTTTITLASITNNHRVDYIKIDYAPRSGRSKIKPIRDTLGFTALIIRTVVYFNPLKVFYPAALSLLALFVFSLSYDLFFVEGAPDMGDKTVLLFVAFVQVMSLGLVADLIDRKSHL